MRRNGGISLAIGRISLEEAILSALVKEKRYGLEIVEALKGLKRISLGSLYVTLHRMERKGLITSDWGETVEPRKGARRRYYWATPSGVEVLREAQRRHAALARLANLITD